MEARWRLQLCIVVVANEPHDMCTVDDRNAVCEVVRCIDHEET